MFRTGKEICHSDTPKTGKLPDEVLDRIRPIMVVESHFNGLAVSPSERTRIEKASGLSGSIPKASGYTVDSAPSAQSADAKVKKRKATPKPEPKTDVTAAQTGDMSAAVNAAMEGAA
ncbi:MAG: hypothetical protein JJ979_25925 [Roseibium sp.]|nr:hypothetical protein [Roseibium sp.]